MKRDLEKTRAALIEAAEKLMGQCEDPNEVTARAITKEAGVNLAMINYCFGSREELLFEAQQEVSAYPPHRDGSCRRHIQSSDPKRILI